MLFKFYSEKLPIKPALLVLYLAFLFSFSTSSFILKPKFFEDIMIEEKTDILGHSVQFQKNHYTKEYKTVLDLKFQPQKISMLEYWNHRQEFLKKKNSGGIFSTVAESIPGNPFNYKTSSPLNLFKENPTGFQDPDPDVERCTSAGPNYFRLLANDVAHAKTPNTIIQTYSACFKDVKFSWNWTSETSQDVTLDLEDSSGSSWYCTDNWLINAGSAWHLPITQLHGTYHYSFRNMSVEDIDLVVARGVFGFLFCENSFDFIPNVYYTLKLFAGDIFYNSYAPRPQWQIDTEIDFMKEAMGYEWVLRKNYVKGDPNSLHIPEKSEIKNGDIFVMQTFNGYGSLIGYGTGAHVEHVVVSVWDGDELYIVESSGSGSPENPKGGIMRTPYEAWMKFTLGYDPVLAFLPIRPELSKKFDAKKVWEWFKLMETTPYGIVNVIFNWIDTPHENYGELVDVDFAFTVAMIQETYGINTQLTVIKEALNQRIGTTDLTMAQVVWEAYRQGYTIPELFAIPEQDDWTYSTGKAFICSAFVAKVWQYGGLFGDQTINATEFTPKDIYQVNFFDLESKVPDDCVARDSDLPYCIVAGSYKLDLPGYSTVDPYDNMNEKCGGYAPHYYREPGC